MSSAPPQKISTINLQGINNASTDRTSRMSEPIRKTLCHRIGKTTLTTPLDQRRLLGYPADSPRLLGLPAGMDAGNKLQLCPADPPPRLCSRASPLHILATGAWSRTPLSAPQRKHNASTNRDFMLWTRRRSQILPGISAHGQALGPPGHCSAGAR